MYFKKQWTFILVNIFFFFFFQVSCGNCGNGLGHEFLKDGPKGNSRFWIFSSALKFKGKKKGKSNIKQCFPQGMWEQKIMQSKSAKVIRCWVALSFIMFNSRKLQFCVAIGWFCVANCCAIYLWKCKQQNISRPGSRQRERSLYM